MRAFNRGISIRDNQLRAQNRSHFVTSAYHTQFKHLDKWLNQHADELWQILDSDRYILYGEWVYARHSIHYQQLPDWFVAFDMLDKLEGKFWSRPRLEKHLEGSRIALVPLVARGAFESAEQLRALLQTQSRFCHGLAEGVYLRRCDDQWLTERGKIVRADFMCGNEFWSKGGVEPNIKMPAEYTEY
jgi:atypical dual specificity phosphatase